MFIFPDRPGATLAPGFLGQIDPELFLCVLKIDGWRCEVRKKDGIITYTSRMNKPIDVPAAIKGPFEARLFGMGDMVLDCEVTGRRRTGDVAGFHILELLEFQGHVHRKAPAIHRWQMAMDVWPDLTVPGTEKDFLAFFEHHKANTPIAEGVVLKRKLSKLIGSTVKSAENSSWMRCKWRAGEDGLSPTEL